MIFAFMRRLQTYQYLKQLKVVIKLTVNFEGIYRSEC